MEWGLQKVLGGKFDNTILPNSSELRCPIRLDRQWPQSANEICSRCRTVRPETWFRWNRLGLGVSWSIGGQSIHRQGGVLAPLARTSHGTLSPQSYPKRSCGRHAILCVHLLRHPRSGQVSEWRMRREQINNTHLFAHLAPRMALD